MILRIMLASVMFCSLGVASSVLAAPAIQEAKKADVIPADKAREHLDKSITTELTVKSAKDAATSKVVYLDSEEDYKAENNLALVIPYAAVEDFKKAGIDDVIKHFMGKKIRVTGKVVRQSDQTRIIVTDVKQIELVK